MKKYKILEHRTDLKVKAQGKDLPELFSNLAQGMFSAVCSSEIKNQRSKVKKRKIKISAKDSEELLVSFLNELIFLSDVYNEIYLDFEFEKLSETELKGVAFGQSIPASGFKTEIKGATFHNLKIKKTKQGYETTVIFDI